jgi:hypothetical protein
MLLSLNINNLQLTFHDCKGECSSIKDNLVQSAEQSQNGRQHDTIWVYTAAFTLTSSYQAEKENKRKRKGKEIECDEKNKQRKKVVMNSLVLSNIGPLYYCSWIKCCIVRQLWC